MRVERFTGNPIIVPYMDDRMGNNINGPSPIRVPDWIEEPLGRYYLYFAHHDGDYIRLAYADCLEGPWRTWRDGVLPLAHSHFRGHIASPDVHVDHEMHRIRMYYHGADTPTAGDGKQSSRVAISSDGLHFEANLESLGPPYFRVFVWQNYHYALAMPGTFLRSRDGLRDFEPGPTLFNPAMRHAAVAVRGHRLVVHYSNAGDCPERILSLAIDLRPDWSEWQSSDPLTVLEPELAYEGADRPRKPSVRGMAQERLCELRDPAFYYEDGRQFLLYSVAGENGIAVAELHEA